MAVATAGVQRTKYLLSTERHRWGHEKSHVASMPQIRCTFMEKKFYLQPGINVRTASHPDYLRNTVLPCITATSIEQQPGQFQLKANMT